jgi:hypothetical protein
MERMSDQLHTADAPVREADNSAWHYWHPLAAKGAATVRVPQQQEDTDNQVHRMGLAWPRGAAESGTRFNTRHSGRKERLESFVGDRSSDRIRHWANQSVAIAVSLDVDRILSQSRRLLKNNQGADRHVYQQGQLLKVDYLELIMVERRTDSIRVYGPKA